LSNGIFDIIDDMQINISELKLNFTSFSLKELIKEIDLIILSYNTEYRVFEFYIYDDVPEYIFTDRLRLKQILINLLKKSISHTIKGKITLLISSICHVNQDDESTKYKLSFIIKDSGIGIPENKKNILLKSTYNSSDHLLNSSGTINICYSLAKLLGGSLKINESRNSELRNSELRSTGSTFQLDILLYENQPPEIDNDTLKKIKNNKIILFKNANSEINFETIISILKIYNISYNYISSIDEIITLFNNIGNIAIINLNDKEDIENYNKLINLNIPVIAIVNKITEEMQYIDHDNIIFSPIDEYIFKNQLLKITNINKINKKREIYIIENTIDDCNVIKSILESLGFDKINCYYNINTETTLNIKPNSIIFLNNKLKNIDQKLLLEKINLTNANLIIYISNNPQNELTLSKPITLSKVRDIFNKNLT
jgi:hypothetical protein